MNTKKVRSLGVFVCAVTVGLWVTQAVEASPKDVKVVNTPEVNVANTPDVNAYQAGEWSLNVDTAAKEFKQLYGRFRPTDGWVEVYQVPSGKQVVVTDIYLRQLTLNSSSNLVSLMRGSSSNECGTGGRNVIGARVNGGDGHEFNYFSLSLQTGYEFVEGQKICIATNGFGVIEYNISGYETDL
jgi:hypothetical protein